MTFAFTLSQNQPEHLKELLHEHCCQHCVPGQPATSVEGSLTQIPSDKPLQRENFSSSLCLTPTLIHPLQLFCSASTAPIISSLSIRLPLLFYLPQITLVLHYLCLFFFQLIFCADLTTAMQSRRGKLYISHPKAWSSHGRTHFCHGRHHKHSHLRSANGLSTTCEIHTYTHTHKLYYCMWILNSLLPVVVCFKIYCNDVIFVYRLRTGKNDEPRC